MPTPDVPHNRETRQATDGRRGLPHTSSRGRLPQSCAGPREAREQAAAQVIRARSGSNTPGFDRDPVTTHMRAVTSQPGQRGRQSAQPPRQAPNTPTRPTSSSPRPPNSTSRTTGAFNRAPPTPARRPPGRPGFFETRSRPPAHMPSALTYSTGHAADQLDATQGVLAPCRYRTSSYARITGARNQALAPPRTAGTRAGADRALATECHPVLGPIRADRAGAAACRSLMWAAARRSARSILCPLG
jgi:hypothetical protein